MFLTNHVLTGGLIGLKIQNPALVGVTAFSSHLILDSLPHFGWAKLAGFRSKYGFPVAAADCVLSFVAYILLMRQFPDHRLNITIGMFFAALPDLAYLPREFLGVIIGKKFMKFHGAIQWGERPWGVVIEAAWMMFIISLLQQIHP